MGAATVQKQLADAALVTQVRGARCGAGAVGWWYLTVRGGRRSAWGWRSPARPREVCARGRPARKSDALRALVACGCALVPVRWCIARAAVREPPAPLCRGVMRALTSRAGASRGRQDLLG